MSGLLINGGLVAVSGVDVIQPASHGGPDWCQLDTRDYRARRTTWTRQIVLHSTKGSVPQHVKPGAGPGGKAKVVADFWRNDPTPSGAHIIVDTDGKVACLTDLANSCCYHATVSNEWSVGIEMYQEAGGGIWEATYASTVLVVRAICESIGIPFQISIDQYDGHPLNRLLNGGPDVCAIYGHRSNTEQRGRGDPGDEIFTRLLAAGADGVKLSDMQDLEIGAARQRWLNAEANRRGETFRPLTVDGLVGPRSLERARQLGIPRWRDVPQAPAVQLR